MSRSCYYCLARMFTGVRVFLNFCVILGFFVILPSVTFAQSNDKIGVVDPQQFLAEFGIKRLINAKAALDDEFHSRNVSLDNLRKQMDDAMLTSAHAPQEEISRKRILYSELEQKYEMEAADMKLRYERRRADLMLPIQSQIDRELISFAKSNRIAMLLDKSKIRGVIWLSDSADVTRAFIEYFNNLPPTGR